MKAACLVTQRKSFGIVLAAALLEFAARGVAVCLGAELRLNPGVARTQVGYANGTTPNPSYQDVCRGDTGHAETVYVWYDVTKTSLRAILTAYFSIIDPTSLNHQGEDHGVQYRTGVYLTGPNVEADRTVAEEVFAVESKKHDKPLAVELKTLSAFYPAEEYHQKYLEKNPGGYCHVDFGHLEEIPSEEQK